MEFEEMKKIWDTQRQKTMYAIDEEALHQRVVGRKEKAARVASRSERVMIGALMFSFTIVMGASIYKSEYEIAPLLLAVTMLGAAIFIGIRRRQRLAMSADFERSILGDINHAIAHATYQVRLSQGSKMLYIVVALLSVFSLVDTMDEWYKGAFVGLLFLVGYFGARWEHKTLYVSQKRSLEEMREQLESWQNEPEAT